MSSEVHSAQRVLVNLNCFSKCLVVSAVALAGRVASFSAGRERSGENTEVGGGREQNPISAASPCTECFHIVCSEQNRQKLITLKTPLKV